jgi:hypothetical protein
MNRIWIVLALLVVFSGCKKDEQKNGKTADKPGIAEKVIGKWHSEVTEKDGRKSKIEIRFADGKITKLRLIESNDKFIPVEDSKKRESVTLFYRIDKSDDKKMELTVSEDYDFPEGKIDKVTVEMTGVDSVKWIGKDGETIIVTRQKG